MVAAGFFIASLFALACSKPLSRFMQKHETRSNVPNGFMQGSSAPSDTVLKLRLALVQSDPAGLEKALYDVSTPWSPRYGQHLTREEASHIVSLLPDANRVLSCTQAAAFAAPTSETQQAAKSWLAENGVNATTMNPAGDWLSITVPASKANELFNADFTIFTHESTGKQAIRTLAYSIPADLKGHIDFVHPFRSADLERGDKLRKHLRRHYKSHYIGYLERGDKLRKH
ncbi:hypothetical protein CERSUDRAFT_74157 [Gelatoporia subvermispora B]|uniref:Peptidase S53 activation domain-containing protein n=1 Tax=Ceriporiopsis subvermispora (strain B) TaxID=914234 RepID=M2QYD8_CERS8|nr:hypothetical protein CERSUDRAFT_74157 [Gelatoporia subvermispora B]